MDGKFPAPAKYWKKHHIIMIEIPSIISWICPWQRFYVGTKRVRNFYRFDVTREMNLEYAINLILLLKNTVEYYTAATAHHTGKATTCPCTDSFKQRPSRNLPRVISSQATGGSYKRVGMTLLPALPLSEGLSEVPAKAEQPGGSCQSGICRTS